MRTVMGQSSLIISHDSVSTFYVARPIGTPAVSATEAASALEQDLQLSPSNRSPHHLTLRPGLGLYRLHGSTHWADRSVSSLRPPAGAFWPGYEYLDFTHKIYLSERGAGGVSCKGELAIEVAKAYDAFLKQAARSAPVNGHPSFFITPSGPFTLGNLALVAVNNVYDGVFQAYVELIHRPAMPRVTPGQVLVRVQGTPGGYALCPAMVPMMVPPPPVGVQYAPLPVMHMGTRLAASAPGGNSPAAHVTRPSPQAMGLSPLEDSSKAEGEPELSPEAAASNSIH
ncbi:hypothetical protein C8T65DRAFT_730460 [Cerioporus squamosus]|nr:hypothetical protein C8T65DRAFT_730460 [Cerioporus squamosus]